MIDRYGCRVLGAEPVSTLTETLPHDDRLTVEHVAIGRSKESARLRPGKTEDAGRLVTEGEERRDDIAVTSISLSTLLERHGVSDVGLIKVDIEGAEKLRCWMVPPIKPCNRSIR
jgi:FkbM family methyltransferase